MAGWAVCSRPRSSRGHFPGVHAGRPREVGRAGATSRASPPQRLGGGVGAALLEVKVRDGRCTRVRGAPWPHSEAAGTQPRPPLKLISGEGLTRGGGAQAGPTHRPSAEPRSQGAALGLPFSLRSVCLVATRLWTHMGFLFFVTGSVQGESRVLMMDNGRRMFIHRLFLSRGNACS